MLKSYIDDELELTKDTWVLSLVQKNISAFLVIEGINENGSRFTQKAELVPNPKEKTKAIIQYYDETSINLSVLNVRDYTYQSWPVSSEKIENEFIPNLKMSMNEGNYGHIKYSLTPKGKNANLFSKSSSEIISHPSTQSYVLADAVSNMLTSKEGHNSVTWANMMVNAIDLQCETVKLKTYFFKHPDFILTPSKDSGSGCTLF
ncbi:MAG: hypothetical protein AB7F64_07050 [Gammaproteobacteria bacterium]